MTLVFSAITVGVFAIAGTVMAVRDVQVHLVRNRDIAVGVGLLLVIAVVWSVQTGQWNHLLFGILGGVSFAVVYVMLALLARGQLGSGDSWVAAFTGLALGMLYPPALIVGWATPFALAALPSVVLWIRKGRGAEIAVIPYLVFSAPISVVIATLM